jgi:uncharacterized protein YndB with AHSA1/START domain
MSIHIEIETMIRCPIEEVFDRLIAIDDYSRWLPQEGVFISTHQRSDGPVNQGTTYTDRTTVGTFQGEVIAFQRPTKIVFRHTLRWWGIAVLESRPGYRLESIKGGTKLHHIADGRLFGLFKLMQPRVARIAREERERTVNALKTSLERSFD